VNNNHYPDQYYDRNEYRQPRQSKQKTPGSSKRLFAFIFVVILIVWGLLGGSGILGGIQ